MSIIGRIIKRIARRLLEPVAANALNKAANALDKKEKDKSQEKEDSKEKDE